MIASPKPDLVFQAENTGTEEGGGRRSLSGDVVDDTVVCCIDGAVVCCIFIFLEGRFLSLSSKFLVWNYGARL